MTAAYIAAGLDPKRSILFNQSQVPEHAELAWVFNCVARLGWLNRMTQFKEKAGKDRETASVGLYAYPNLMAADILPTGRRTCRSARTRSSISSSRATSRRSSTTTSRPQIEKAGFADGNFFPLPEPVITGPATRVMSLRDGTKKMSKSDPSDLSRINLTDDADTIAKKIQKAKTDPEPLPSEAEGLEGRPEAENLVGIYAALAGKTEGEVLDGVRRGAVLRPSRRRWPSCASAKLGADRAPRSTRLMADPAEIDRILADGAARARAIAKPIMDEVKDIVGFVRVVTSRCALALLLAPRSPRGSMRA